ncbi:hypothetical protein [uncultured Winogradskyella sp.]|uniref:hypothetical protein n=1 Tax=uncultured Winogradskyella sp. TaxID=395353 RepID=UPI002626DC20|nr:hypothetical protein [uncultured Winogradskyella sp.]
MKKLIAIIAIVFTQFCSAQELIEITPDSIAIYLDIVAKGRYNYVLRDGDSISRSTLINKANSQALLQSIKYPNSNITVSQPDLEPRTNFKVFIDKSKLQAGDNSDLQAQIDSLKQAVEFQASAINNLYLEEIPNLKRQMQFADSLNSKKIDVLKARIETLQTFIRDSIAFVVENPTQPTTNLLGDLRGNTGDWQVSDKSYTYMGNVSNRYITFNLKEPIQVGERIKISFHIEAPDKIARLSIWLYELEGVELPAEWESPKITDEIEVENGYNEIIYKVKYVARNSIGFRANIAGGQFTKSNIKLERL